MADSMFPNLFDAAESSVAPVNPEWMTYPVFAIAIKSLTQTAAACALIGDIKMGQAFVQASSILVEFAMDRWPSVPVKDTPELMAAALEEQESSRSTTEGDPAGEVAETVDEAARDSSMKEEVDPNNPTGSAAT